jgi:Taurine catabolism dioxygenase TauD, TfdA family
VNDFHPIVLTAPTEIANALKSICDASDALEAFEQMARADALQSIPLLVSAEWSRFAARVRDAFASRDSLIIKGLPASTDGATLIPAAHAIGENFRTYRGEKIVKHFKMSPWTTELSHTTREGEFHTDLNTERYPPAITGMQCLDPDPGAPLYGVSRVVRLTDLLAQLHERHDTETSRFLTQDTVTMLNDRSCSSWSGSVVEGNLIRYHPETLRAAARRSGQMTEPLEDRIAAVARAAFAVSEPFIMDRGDILLLSNHRNIHYRGECSVLFKHYPTEFLSRSIFILHAHREREGS